MWDSHQVMSVEKFSYQMPKSFFWPRCSSGKEKAAIAEELNAMNGFLSQSRPLGLNRTPQMSTSDSVPTPQQLQYQYHIV